MASSNDYLFFSTKLPQPVFINDSVVTLFPINGGNPVAKKTYCKTVESTERVVKRLCQDEQLTGEFTAVVCGLFGNAQLTFKVEAEIPQPTVEVSFS